MAIDKERADNFNRDLQDIEQSLEFDEFYQTIKAKLLDLVARGELNGETFLQFKRQVSQVLNPEFINFVDRVYQSYNQTIDLVNTHYSDIGVDIHRDLDRIQAIEKVNNTRLGDYENSVARGITRQIRKGLAAGERTDAIARRLADLDDKVTSYANTIARTQIKGYGRTLKGEKARIAEVYFYEYIGLIRSGTRRFCMELLQQSAPIFHLNDIRQMQNAQIGNVFDYCGGWNCHHDWEPDPTVKKDGYSVTFYTVKVNKRTLKLARSTSEPQPNQQPATEFKPASTLKEAEDFARVNLINEGAKNKVSYTGIKLDFANEINKALFNLKDSKYDSIRTYTHRGKQRLNVAMRNSTEIPGGRNELQINKLYFEKYNSLDQVNQDTKAIHDKNWWVPERLEHLVYHEYGHKLTRYNVHKEEIVREKRALHATKIVYDTKGLSEYASYSLNETLAEIFCKHQKGEDIKPAWKKLFNEYSEVKI